MKKVTAEVIEKNHFLVTVDVIKSKESLLSDIRFFIKEFTSRMSEEE